MDTRCVFEHLRILSWLSAVEPLLSSSPGLCCMPATALPNFLDCVCACCSVLAQWNGRQQEWRRLNEQREEPELNFGRVISGAGGSKQSKGLCFLLLSVWQWGNIGQLPLDPSLIKRFFWVRTGIEEEVINWTLCVPCSALVLLQDIDSASRSEASEETAPFPLQTEACGACSSSRLPLAGEEADCPVFCTWTPVTMPSIRELAVGCRRCPLSEGRTNALSVVGLCWC